MTSSTWALLCFIGILASGTLGTSPQFGSHNRQIHSIRPVIPRVSPQVSPRANRRFEGVKSIEQTSDEEPSSETFQEVQLGDYTARGFQQQEGAGPGANNYLKQERRRAEDGGWLLYALCPRRSFPISIHLLCSNPPMPVCAFVMVWVRL